MKNILYFIPMMLLISCGGDAEESETTTEPEFYGEDHELIVSAKTLKDKFAQLQESFQEIGNKEVEETVCQDGWTVPYEGDKDEMNIWLMTTYMLDNFSNAEFGKHGFRMPAVQMKNGTPLTELNWLNMNHLDTMMFNIYKEFPDLTEIPAGTQDDNLNKTRSALKAVENGFLGVLAITDYLPPVYNSATDFETGYLMGYIMFADWEAGQLSCISPFLAQNSHNIDFDHGGNNGNEQSTMLADLQEQTFHVIDSIARLKTNFKGEVTVNNSIKLRKYQE